MAKLPSQAEIETNTLWVRARDQYVASLAALANAAPREGQPSGLELADLPQDLARLVEDYLRSRPRRGLVLLSRQQFVDGQLQAVVGDRHVVPDGENFVGLSRSLTLVAAEGTHSVVDLFVARIEAAPPRVAVGKPVSGKRRAKVTRTRRKTTARTRAHA